MQKDQLYTIAVMKGKWIVKVLHKMVVMATSRTLNVSFISSIDASTSCSDKIWLSKKHIVQVYVSSCDMNLSFDS